MQTDRQIDRIMAEKILGHSVFHEQRGTLREKLPNGQTRPLRPYSTDISAAWEVANKVGISLLPTTEGWFALVGTEKTWRSPGQFLEYLAKADFARAGAAVTPEGPMAICLAALRSLENQESFEASTASEQTSPPSVTH